MSPLEQSKAILETIRADLKREKETILAHLKDPRVADWQSIDLKANQALLTGIGIDPAGISAALAGYPAQAKKIGKQIVDWGNEVGNQLADLIGQPKPEIALAAAQRLEEKCRGLAAMKEELLATTSRLLKADQALRQQLGLRPVLALAKLLVTSKKDFFDGGLAILNLLLASTDNRDGQTLSEMCQEPAKLETRFQRLDVTKLPRIAEEILFHHIDEATIVGKEVGIFLEALNLRMARDLDSIAAVERELNTLSAATSTAALLHGLNQQILTTSGIISSLYHKRQIKETMATVNEALEALNVFHLLLKNRIIPGLQKEIEVPGSALNPVTISSRMTRSFFMGATGMIRSLKLMMTSLTGQAAINEIELQLTLERGIANCKTFYAKSHADLKKMTLYIDGLIGQYPRPFPYTDLFKLTRSTLTAYGDEVEKYIQNYDIPTDMQTLPAIPAKTGKLTAVIGKHKKAFRKANADTI